MAKLEDYFTAQSALNALCNPNSNTQSFPDYNDNLFVETCNVPEFNTTVIYAFMANVETVHVAISYTDDYGGVNYVKTVKLNKHQVAQYDEILN